MSAEPGNRPPRVPGPGGRRWNVRLFETAETLEEHLNRQNLRPDQVTSLSIDGDGFFVLVYHIGGPPAESPRPPRPEFVESRPAPQPWRRDDGGGDFGGGDDRPPRRPREDFEDRPPRRPREDFDDRAPRRSGPPSPRPAFNRSDGPPTTRRDLPPRRTPRR